MNKLGKLPELSMLDIIEIRNHARKAADEQLTADACPFTESSVHGQLWRDYYFTQVRWLSGESSE